MQISNIGANASIYYFYAILFKNKRKYLQSEPGKKPVNNHSAKRGNVWPSFDCVYTITVKQANPCTLIQDKENNYGLKLLKD